MEVLNDQVAIRKKVLFKDILIFGLFSIFSVIIADAYLFNPLILLLLQISYLRSGRAYLTSNLTMIATSLLINFKYGLEITLISTLFLGINLLFKIPKKDYLKEKHLNFYCALIILFAAVIIYDHSLASIVNGAFNLLLAAIGVLSFHQLLNVLKNDYQPFNEKAKVIVISFLSLIGIGVQPIFFLLFKVAHFISLRINTFAVFVSSLILSSCFLYFFKLFTLEQILIMAIPLLIGASFRKKDLVLTYLISHVLICIFHFETFYLEGAFYQGLATALIYLLIPKNWIINAERIFSREANQEIINTSRAITKTQNHVSQIISYLDKVLDPSLENHNTALSKAYHQIENNLCSFCQKRSQCSLVSIIEEGITNKISKDHRQEIISACVYPYKLLKRICMSKEIYLHEQQIYQELQEKKNLYQHEIQNIYTPIEDLLHQDFFKSPKEKITRALINAHIPFLKVLFSDQEIIIESDRIEEINLTNLIEIIKEVTKTSCYIKNNADLYQTNNYRIILSLEPLIKVDYFVRNEGYLLNENGDNYLYEDEEQSFCFAFSDGMGHDITSYQVSKYLLDALFSLKKLETKPEKLISHLNTLLKSKSLQENYATLDYLDLNLVTKTAKLYKGGSFPSYLYSGSKLYELNKMFPPLGIIDNLDVTTNEFSFEPDAILILLSDGFGVSLTPIIEKTLSEHHNKSAEEIGIILFDLLKKQESSIDDKSLIVLKSYEKSKIFA